MVSVETYPRFHVSSFWLVLLVLVGFCWFFVRKNLQKLNWQCSDALHKSFPCFNHTSNCIGTDEWRVVVCCGVNWNHLGMSMMASVRVVVILVRCQALQAYLDCQRLWKLVGMSAEGTVRSSSVSEPSASTSGAWTTNLPWSIWGRIVGLQLG